MSDLDELEAHPIPWPAWQRLELLSCYPGPFTNEEMYAGPWPTPCDMGIRTREDLRAMMSRGRANVLVVS